MPKIEMLKDERGSVNGVDIVDFESGQIYEVNENLFDVFVNVNKTAKIPGEETTGGQGEDDEPSPGTIPDLRQKLETLGIGTAPNAKKAELKELLSVVEAVVVKGIELPKEDCTLENLRSLLGEG